MTAHSILTTSQELLADLRRDVARIFADHRQLSLDADTTVDTLALVIAHYAIVERYGEQSMEAKIDVALEDAYPHARYEAARAFFQAEDEIDFVAMVASELRIVATPLIERRA